MPGRRFGSRSERAAFSRNLAAKSALTHHQRLHLVGIRQQQARIGRQVDIRKSHHEPIVAPQNLDVRAGLLPNPGGDGHRPRSVDAPAARRQHADAPVAELVADALDHDRDGIGKGA